MLQSAIVRVTDICTRHPWYVIAAALALSAFSAGYTEQHFAIKTDVNELISPDLPWAQRVKAFLGAFPQREILVVVNAPTPELVEQAANRLQEALQSNSKMFPSVRQPSGGKLFERNGLLYLPTEEVKKV